jgi:hypothetical protein
MPEPVVLKGSGKKVVDFDNPFNIAIAHITYTGGGNFAVRNYGDSPNYYDLLVNTIGRYDGIVPIDFGDGEHTTRFEVIASGPWTIEVKHPIESHNFAVPGTFEGKGDDVIRLVGYKQNPPDIAHITHDGKSNFAVYGYADEGRTLLVNEIGKYEGDSILSPTTFLMVVKADGKWTIDLKTR